MVHRGGGGSTATWGTPPPPLTAKPWKTDVNIHHSRYQEKLLKRGRLISLTSFEFCDYNTRFYDFQNAVINIQEVESPNA